MLPPGGGSPLSVTAGSTILRRQWQRNVQLHCLHWWFYSSAPPGELCAIPSGCHFVHGWSSHSGISSSPSAAPAPAVTAAAALDEDKDANWIEAGWISPYQSHRSRLIYPTSTSATAITTIAATRCHYWSRRLFTGFPSAAFIASGSRDPFRLRQSQPPEKRSPPNFYILWNRRAPLYFGVDGRRSSDVTGSPLATPQATAAVCEGEAEFVHYSSCCAFAICHVLYSLRSSCDS